MMMFSSCGSESIHHSHPNSNRISGSRSITHWLNGDDDSKPKRYSNLNKLKSSPSFDQHVGVGFSSNESSSETMNKTVKEHDDRNDDEDRNADSMDIDMDFVDKLLNESIRLKRKCKMLRDLIHDMEEQQVHDREEYEKEIDRREGLHQGYISELKTQHYLEVTSLKTSMNQSYQETILQLQYAKEEIHKYENLTGKLRERLQDIDISHKKELEQYTQRLQQSEEDSKTYHSHMETAQTTIATLHQKLKDLEQYHSTQVKEKDDDYQSKYEKLQRQIQEIEENRRDMTIVLEKAQEDLNRMRLEHDNSVRKVHAMEIELSQVKTQKQEYLVQYQATKKLLESMGEERNQITSERNNLQQQYDMLLESYDKNEEKDMIENGRDEYDVQKIEKEELIRLLKLSKDEIIRLRHVISDIDKKKEAVLHDVNQVIQENQNLRRQLSNRLSLGDSHAHPHSHHHHQQQQLDRKEAIESIGVEGPIWPSDDY